MSRPAYTSLLASLVALALGAGCAGVAHAPPPPPGSVASGADATNVLRVMTFNIRYGTAPDGDDAWPVRRGLALRVIRDFGPGVLGLQEALRFQLDEIEAALPDYGEIGVGRDDGAQAGEYAAILYDRRRLTPLAEGRFWLSDTPETPGSMTWGNRFPRIVTWVRLGDRVSGATFHVFDTHWDHESQEARERGARLMLERMAARLPATDPVIVTGDLNSGEDTLALKTLTALPLADTFRALHPSLGEVGTFHAFHGSRSGPKIDTILASPEWQVLEAEIVHTSDNGHYPSDHFPVTAKLLLNNHPTSR